MSFSRFPLHEEQVNQLSQLGFEQPTEVQQQTLEALLQGQDVVAQAQTGSGKTLAFALSIAHQIQVEGSTQALVLCPTRELAAQVAEVIRQVIRWRPNIKVLTLCGGEPMGPQIQSLRHAPHVIVGTPGRILAHIQKRRLQFQQLRALVLDEADRMLDTGFAEDLDAILFALPKGHQSLLFSATFDEATNALCQRWLPDALRVESSGPASAISQLFYRCEDENRTQSVAALLSEYQPESAILFCNTKRFAASLADDLIDKGFSVLSLHGDLDQRQRNEVLLQFANGSCRYLVATDVAARGLDIDDVPLVLNVQVAFDLETHTHRIGRTGRAGKTGQAITLTSPTEQNQWETIQASLSQTPKVKSTQAYHFQPRRVLEPIYRTLKLNVGKKQKIRAGDIVGALTKDQVISGDEIGQIKQFPEFSYVAVKVRSCKRAMQILREGRIKGKKAIVRRL